MVATSRLSRLLFSAEPTKLSKEFEYDRAYWSHDPKDEDFATQQHVMDEIGETLLDNAMAGYNDTLLSYGQTGSGKTHSVIGGKDIKTDAGLLPRMLHRVFEMMQGEVEKAATPGHFLEDRREPMLAIADPAGSAGKLF